MDLDEKNMNQSDYSSDTITLDYDDSVSISNNMMNSGLISNGLYNGSSGISTSNIYTSNITNTITLGDLISSKNTGLNVQGDSIFDGDITVKGKSLLDTLEKIEARLAILHVNEKLEDKWEELKKLGDQYRSLEQDLLEKEKIYSILKNT